MGKDLALYLGAFMVCTVILIIPGVIFLLFWAVTRNDGAEQHVEHHHHYNNRKTLNIMHQMGYILWKNRENLTVI